MGFHFVSFFRTLRLMAWALLYKVPDLEEPASSPLGRHCSQCGPRVAASAPMESLAVKQDGRLTADLLSRHYLLKRCPCDVYVHGDWRRPGLVHSPYPNCPCFFPEHISFQNVPKENMEEINTFSLDQMIIAMDIHRFLLLHFYFWGKLLSRESKKGDWRLSYWKALKKSLGHQAFHCERG